MKVDLIDHMGSDLSVVNAARVSFDKESSLETVTKPCRCATNERCIGCDGTYSTQQLSKGDTNLISYLAKHNHWSPFSHCFVKFRIKAPIFVARQLQKHVVGLAWNEVSRRYVDSKPELYKPNEWRKRAENVKQGSSDEIVDLEKHSAFDGEHVKDYVPRDWGVEYKESMIPEYSLQEWLDDNLDTSLKVYKTLLKAGVAPEQARMVLPQATYTEWIWSGSLYAFARVCVQRLDSHAQTETRWIAEQIAEHMKEIFPISWEALMENS